jgi:MarR family transcriptional regulator for hemolysin
MEKAGLLTRRRDPDNRRIHLVELTEAGEELFLRLRDAAGAFDRRLRRGVAAAEIRTVEAVLERLAVNAASAVGGDEGTAAWSGLIEHGRGG